nr:MAG TPA: hypothetical protein [Caudoviricetes sp.]
MACFLCSLLYLVLSDVIRIGVKIGVFLMLPG